MQYCVHLLTNVTNPLTDNTPLDLHAAALLLGVQPSTVRAYINRGALRGIKLSPRAFRVTHADIQTFLESRATLPAPAASKP